MFSLSLYILKILLLPYNLAYEFFLAYFLGLLIFVVLHEIQTYISCLRYSRKFRLLHIIYFACDLFTNCDSCVWITEWLIELLALASRTQLCENCFLKNALGHCKLDLCLEKKLLFIMMIFLKFRIM